MDDIDDVRDAADSYRRRLGAAPPVFPYLGMDGLATVLREAVERDELLSADTLAARLGLRSAGQQGA